MFHHLVIVVLMGLAIAAPQNKLSPELGEIFKGNQEAKANIFIEMQESNENVLARVNSGRFSSRTVKINSMKTQLEQLAETSQKGIRAILAAQGLSENKREYRSFWIANRLFVRDATKELVDLLLEDPEVAHIRAEKLFHIPETIAVEPKSSIKAEWGVDKIEAEAAWNLPGGNNGGGVIVSHIDTGVRRTHIALRDNFRNDSYGWYDPYEETVAPVDDHGHGTHTMGTIAGAFGIGVAPGAEWKSCRGCSSSVCHEYALMACGEWTVCPTRFDGSDADCSKTPQLSSNSWGGGQGDTTYLPVINAYHTAGIIPIFAIGNSGPACGSANSPGDLENVIGVGATEDRDTVIWFSSRGPSVNGLVKPDISAPGGTINSSVSYTDYTFITMDGTSMATPHVAGTVALLLGRDPNLTFDQVKALITESAETKLGSAISCGGTGYEEIPNHMYGHGRLNARKAMELLIQ